MGEATAAEPPPDPAAELKGALRAAAAAVEGCTREVRKVLADKGDLLEVMHCAHLIAETNAAIRAASMALVASGQPVPAPEVQAPRRHRHRAPSSPRAGRALWSVPSTATRVAAVAGIVALGGSGFAAMHEDASYGRYAAAPASHAVLHRMAPDGAAVIPQAPSSSPRPSAAAASARPAPVVTGRPVAPVQPPAPSPSPSVTVTAAPALDVPRLLNLGGSIFGQLTLAATGPGEVAWTATAKDGIRLSSYAGVAVAGQPVTLQVTDPSGDGGWVYISFGPSVIPVHVVSGLGVPALALP